MELVIRNLLSNAIKFTQQGGLITVTGILKEEKVVLTVVDNGIGIPEKEQQLVFTSDIKPSVGTMHEKGIGLGLFLCKEFIEMQHGAISFTSKTGEGTCFYISLPAV